MTETTEYLSLDQAKDSYPVSYATLRRWLKEGVLTRYTVGGGTVRPRVRIRRAELEQLLTPTAVDRISA